MREIEYRGRALRSKLWVKGYYWTNENGNHFIRQAVDLNGCFRIADIEVDPETVGQYTGIEDKNEVKIYSGDILKAIHNNHIHIGKVEYNEEYCEYRIELVDAYTNLWKKLDLEVIGNIVDNKLEELWN